MASKNLRRSARIQEQQAAAGASKPATICLPFSQNAALTLSAAEELPAEMFYQIFQYVDKKSLKNSREVCKTWRNNIDNNSKLFKLLTLTVVDISEFLNSDVADKLKSVRFTKPLEGSTKALEKFFMKIGATIEEVFINFAHWQTGGLVGFKKQGARQKLMFSMILRFCSRLTLLIIKPTASSNYDFIKGCTEDPRNVTALSKIQHLSIEVKVEYLEDFRNLVVNLPNLRHIELKCKSMGYLKNDAEVVAVVDPDENYDLYEEITQQKFPGVVLDHIKKYNGKLQEIVLMEDKELSANILMKLLLSIGKLAPNTNVKCNAKLIKLLDFKETENIQVTKNSCRVIKEGLLKFDSNYDVTTDTSRIGLCSNLHSLVIESSLQTSLINFGFIKELKNLVYLRVKDKQLGNEYGEEENNNFLSEVFSVGIPSLSKLDLQGQGLALNSISFHTCLPNLTKLYLRDYIVGLNDDFIYDLTKLDQLTSLTLDFLKKLTDEHLTRVYDFFDEEDGKISQLPAIAGIKKLRYLHIADCEKLTDNSLVNGLALCNKLEKIKLCFVNVPGLTEFTDHGLSILQARRDFIVEVFPGHLNHSTIAGATLHDPKYVYMRFRTKNLKCHVTCEVRSVGKLVLIPMGSNGGKPVSFATMVPLVKKV